MKWIVLALALMLVSFAAGKEGHRLGTVQYPQPVMLPCASPMPTPEPTVVRLPCNRVVGFPGYCW